MKKVWRVVILIVLIAMLFGALCLGVGILTGADTSRIYSILNNRYNLDNLIVYLNDCVRYYNECLDIVSGAISSI